MIILVTFLCVDRVSCEVRGILAFIELFK